jgi:hypothetical protein
MVSDRSSLAEFNDWVTYLPMRRVNRVVQQHRGLRGPRGSRQNATVPQQTSAVAKLAPNALPVEEQTLLLVASG